MRVAANHCAPETVAPAWVSLSFSLSFLFRHPRLLGWSLLLVVLTGTVTWGGYLLSVDLINSLTASSFTSPPTVEKFWHWPLLWGWTAAKWFFLLASKVVAFYLAFLAAYCLTTPGYVFLSTWTGNLYSGRARAGETRLTVGGALTDLYEGVKIGLVGLVTTIVSLFANFIPVIGQALVFTVYVFYSALMFVDFPSSRYRWSLGRKIRWVREHRRQSFRLGIMPAMISMVPLLNVFFMALFFPLFTVHTTLNFLAIEGRRELAPRP